MSPAIDPDIDPDDKNWTWVLERSCPECGFDGRLVQARDVASLVRENVAAWPAVLKRPDVAVRSRPDRWSALEYACHVRDVFALYDERLQRMLTVDAARFANWDQDVTALETGYRHQSPAVVAGELVAAGLAVADSFASVADDQWGRTGHRSDGVEFTVDTFARYFVHDPIHHLWDVTVAG